MTTNAPADNDRNAALTALRSVHTNTFPPLLRHLGISLLVTTYQAGKLVVVRADGEQLNTHFRLFDRPMGLAVAGGDRFAIGTQRLVEEFRNMPAVAARLDPPGKHDGVFLPRRLHVTGDIDIHEMAFDSDGLLWFVNTRFSCLCTLDAANSFVPRWRPPFVSAYSPTDRCHLNGLAMRAGKPCYVTALGRADSDQGWRAHKADGGVLMAVDNNEMILEGLSMPHSPRWYDNKLWVLESGRGGIGFLERGTLQTIARLPGFTRGLDFAGRFAFVGVSQVRETATFSGIPLTREQSERNCGVWVVDLGSGDTVAFLRFEEAVQEIFAVAVLPGLRFPDVINQDPQLIGLSYALPDAALKEAFVPRAVDNAASHQQRGIELVQAGKQEEACAEFRQALALQPDLLPARFNLGVTLSDLDRFDAAVEQLLQVVADEAAHADAHRALGYAYSRLRRIDAAIDHLRRAIAVRPEFAEAHLDLGMLLLLTGDYKTGWGEFEWRWRTPGFTPFTPPDHPLWNGEPMPAGTLLIHTEQGTGDAIQFFRFLPEVAKRCRRLVLVAPKQLHALLEGLAHNLSWREAGALEKSEFDAYLPIMSLPQVLKIHGTAAIPATVPYLRADPARVPLPTVVDRLRVGLVWSGNPTFADNRHRSLPLEQLLPLLRTAGIEWFSLQKGDAAKELDKLPRTIPIHDLDLLLHDYGDTASVITRLDLVIGVDTSVCHLAGALGSNTWVLLHTAADWRWQLCRSDSPWYPTMRLFRQRQAGEWEAVVAELAEALKSESRNRGSVNGKRAFGA